MIPFAIPARRSPKSRGRHGVNELSAIRRRPNFISSRERFSAGGPACEAQSPERFPGQQIADYGSSAVPCSVVVVKRHTKWSEEQDAHTPDW